MNNNPPGSEPLITKPPAFDVAEAARIAECHFGKSGKVSELGGSRDQNFCVETETGDEFVLKISNSADDSGILDFQTQAIQHIHSSASALPVMEIVSTIDGSLWTSIDDDSESHFVRMFTFVPGRVASAEELDSNALHAYGETVAEVGQALRGFFHPEARYEILWDPQYTLELRSLLNTIDDDQRRAAAKKILDRFEDRVDPIFNNLRAQVVHYDLRLDNVLLDNNNRVSGIIDFGDLTYTALVCDLAVALTSVMYQHDEPVKAAQSVIRGYVSVTPIEEMEAALLADLVSARLVTWGIISAWRGEEYPDSMDHNTASVDDGWELLMDIEETGPDLVRRCLRTAALASNVPYPQIETTELVSRRRQALGSSPLSYREPVHFIDGTGVWLFDPSGRRYLDAYNNVQSVGHANPYVTTAIAGQARKLATNTRYLHESVVTLGERLLDTMPDRLDTILLANSGSEANDIAWRLATASTGGEGAIVSDNAYHGLTSATAALSPEIWPDEHHPDHVETFSPSVDDSNHQRIFAGKSSRTAAGALEELEKRGTSTAAFLFDPLFTSDGIFAPKGEKLKRAVDRVHEAGGVVIADEVQAGHGRIGSHLWGFQAEDIVPDIVTMGKPMGNGHPVAAVVTRSDIASSLMDQTKMFSTFGGNPVSSAAALAVLEFIEKQELLTKTTDVGEYLQTGLAKLSADHDLVGEVRQRGLMVGVELVRDQETWTPATSETTDIVNGLRQHQILIGSTGRNNNILKIRPPLVFERPHADRLLEVLDDVISDVE